MYINPILGIVLVAAAGAAVYVFRHFLISGSKARQEKKIENQLEDAKVKAKEIVLEAENKSADILEEIKKEERERKQQLDKLEDRFRSKEEALQSEVNHFRLREEKLIKEQEEIKKRQSDLEELRKKSEEEIQKVAGLTSDKAKELLIKRVYEDNQKELSSLVQKLNKERREELESKAKDIMTVAIQRYSHSHVSEITTAIFNLENEDLKGKIIGREGRNIKALERSTGVEFIIDESPDYIVISSFDPMRREIARLALEKLMKDGRIQPARIEEKVEEAKEEMNKRTAEIGEEAVYEVGLYDLPKEIVQLLGRLHFRTSYGQNVLLHSLEATHLAAMMAAELGLNVEVAKKAALLHDIGKAIDHEVGGSHIELGRKILKKYNISEEVIKAMEAHHEDYPFATPESFVVTAADALSASRPGARRESLENYIKRLEDLEKIANGFAGVKNSYAISAGRELRIFVTPEKIDDFGAYQLAKDVADRIEAELKYPGEIKVNVIREVKAVEYAK